MEIRPQKQLRIWNGKWYVEPQPENLKNVVGLWQINLFHSSSLIVFDILFRQAKKINDVQRSQKQFVMVYEA